MAYKKSCLPKKDGGIGFKSFNEFNQVLVAKKLWRLNKYQNALVTRVLKKRYFWNVHPFNAKKPYRPSYGWKIIWASKFLIDKGVRCIIGPGQQTLVWSDKWLPDKEPRTVMSRLADVNSLLKV